MGTYADILQVLFNIVLLAIQVIIILVTLYYVVLSIMGMRRKSETDVYDPVNRFAVVVAAHNEERVIAPLIENLRNMNYPRELFDIFVVADNCTDNTAFLAKNAGANVFKRFDEAKRGKGYALEFLFAKIFELDQKYDAFVLFDADNLVKDNFLSEMNKKLCQGNKIIQGYVDSKNPFDTWVTTSFSIAFWMMNRLVQLGRFNLGVSNTLAGTGMCISYDVLKQFGWGAHSLVEDLEFTMKAVAHGVKTSWAHDAIVYDEKPLGFIQSCHQRKRWAQGQVDVALRYLPLLVVKGFREKKLMYFDAAMHLFQPFFLIMSFAFIILQIFTFLQPYYINLFIDYIPAGVWQIISGSVIIFAILSLYLDKKPSKAYIGLILYPIFMYSWIPIIIAGFVHHNRREWSHTLHTRSISYEEIVGSEEKISAS
ncbi:glycosyltransferase [Dehalobacter sp. DCM]|uniref:glycosyltransferase family 2 protein n=1 Tax=Dehalobacter sp. DCM TaxID=2907827 RepID=UPI003081F702|nr:glycosyltransferase [Dehalobacter sp. DCM]